VIRDVLLQARLNRGRPRVQAGHPLPQVSLDGRTAEGGTIECSSCIQCSITARPHENPSRAIHASSGSPDLVRRSPSASNQDRCPCCWSGALTRSSRS
jgi:hypothetical protein